ncbi:MAG: DUF2155 domain-containing protein [Alphaproteobacteria bacterium]|jgi:hypothetical protein|nr:DUF2155 domain-containing protein [Alphaproteobacteria bacterium]
MIIRFLLLFFGFYLLTYANSFAVEYTKSSQAQVRVLNKYTGKTEKVTLKVGKSYIFDKNLNILLRACYKSSVQDEPESKAFIQVIRVVSDSQRDSDIKTLDIAIPKDFKVKLNENEIPKFIFSGWLFASSPSVSYLEDITYDITLLTCY